MSGWPGKYVIGLTGNIATGKSVVRKMLEHLGAYGIDADALSHRAIAQDAPGYQSVVNTFGRWILAPDGQIDRARLGKIVFSDPDALSRLEAIIHPMVRQAVDILARRATQKVIVIEAIKLLESPLRSYCDGIWVTYAPPNVQLSRLVQKRSLSEAAARQRIAAQASQEEKLTAATVVIRNDVSYDDTWKQVLAAWQETFPEVEGMPAIETAPRTGMVSVQRARPRQAAEIAALVNRLSGGIQVLNASDIMAAFGEKAFMLLNMNGKLVGVAGWKVENLVARTSDIFLDTNVPFAEAGKVLMEEVERASHELQCEISLLFLPEALQKHQPILEHLGYQARSISALGVRAWQEAAAESMVPGTILLFKQLRQDRVLRPV